MPNLDKTSDHNICYKCIEDSFLRKEMKENGRKVKCNYCDRKAIGYTFDDFAERVGEAILDHYERSAIEPDEDEYKRMHVFKDPSYYWYREGSEMIDILEDHIVLPEGAAEDIIESLRAQNYDHSAAEMGEESEFDREALYEPKGFSDEKWQKDWSEFENILKSQNRYFNEEVNNYLTRIFKAIEHIQTEDKSPLIIVAGPERNLNSLYRARVFQSEEKLMESLTYPEKHLGPPPSEFAGAGRMNARGIPVFYGATDPQVSLAEVRPPVGSRVAIAKFEIIRDLRLLNLPAFDKIRSHFEGSIFDPKYVPDLERAVFLKNLSKRMIIPVMPDHEVFEYLPTQVIADFLSSKSDLNCDGIIFPSNQVPGESLNVVLFNKASKVSSINLTNDTTLTVESEWQEEEDGEFLPDINIIENNPPISKSKTNEPDIQAFIETLRQEYQTLGRADRRPVTLDIDQGSIIIHTIKGVAFQTVTQNVKRIKTAIAKPNRFTKPKTDDF